MSLDTGSMLTSDQQDDQRGFFYSSSAEGVGIEQDAGEKGGLRESGIHFQ